MEGLESIDGEETKQQDYAGSNPAADLANEEMDAMKAEAVKQQLATEVEDQNLFLQNPSQCGRFSDFMEGEGSTEENHSTGAAVAAPHCASLSSSGKVNCITTVAPPIDGLVKPAEPMAFAAAQPLSAEQLLRNLSEQSFQQPWFSVLPRFPCDERSITRPQTVPVRPTMPKYYQNCAVNGSDALNWVFNGACPAVLARHVQAGTSTANLALMSSVTDLPASQDYCKPQPIPIGK